MKAIYDKNDKFLLNSQYFNDLRIIFPFVDHYQILSIKRQSIQLEYTEGQKNRPLDLVTKINVCARNILFIIQSRWKRTEKKQNNNSNTLLRQLESGNIYHLILFESSYLVLCNFYKLGQV